jgi:hypothetical protein
MGVGPGTGLIVVVMKNKIAVFQNPLCNVCAYKSCFTTDLSFSRAIWLGVSDCVYCHRIQQTGLRVVGQHCVIASWDVDTLS